MLEPDVTTAIVAPCVSRSGLGRWAVANPSACAGLWFAGAAALLSGQALVFLPGLLAEARTGGGVAAWQMGAIALAHVYLSPALLALVLGAQWGAPIVRSGMREGPAAALRGALVGLSSLLAWALMGGCLYRALAGSVAETVASLPASIIIGGLVLLPIPFVVVGLIGAGAGHLLHALVTHCPPQAIPGAAPDRA